jgi:hypothetical protein
MMERQGISELGIEMQIRDFTIINNQRLMQIRSYRNAEKLYLKHKYLIAVKVLT